MGERTGGRRKKSEIINEEELVGISGRVSGY